MKKISLFQEHQEFHLKVTMNKIYSVVIIEYLLSTGLSHAKISEESGLSVNTVRTVAQRSGLNKSVRDSFALKKVSKREFDRTVLSYKRVLDEFNRRKTNEHYKRVRSKTRKGITS